jgi:hypothetical protein
VTQVGLSVVLAVLAAMANATAVLQRKAARREPAHGRLSVDILMDLLRQPAWLGGITAIVIGFALQAAALRPGRSC